MNLRSSTRLSRVFLVLTIVNDPIEYSIFGWKQKKEVWFEDKGKIWLWFYFLGVWHSVPIKTCLGKWRAYFLWGDQEKKRKWRRKMLYRFCKHENLYSLPVHVLSDAHWAVSQQTPFPQNLQMKKWWKSEKIWLRPPLCPGAPQRWPQLDDCHSPPVQSAVDSPGMLFCYSVCLIFCQQSTHLACYSVEKSDRLNLTFDRGISRRMSMLVRMIEVIFDISWASWLLMDSTSSV